MEWKKVKLGEVAAINPSNVKADRYQGTTINYYDISSVGSGHVDCIQKIPFEDAPSRAKRTIEKGDFIIATVRPGNKSYYFFDKCSFEDIVSTGFAVIRANDNIDSKFLYYSVTQPTFINYLVAHQKGTTYPAVDANILMRGEISLPPLPYQRRISSILSDYDSLIENYQRQISLLEESAKRIYKEWFVDFKFPGVEMAENGLPKGWQKKKLGEICEITAGGDKPKIFSENQNNHCNIPVFSNGTSNYGLFGYTNKAIVFDNSITISARGSIGYVCLREEPFVPIVRLIVVKPNFLNHRYLYLAALNMTFLAIGAAQQQLTVPMVSCYSIIVPSDDISKKIDAIVNPIFDQIKSLTSQIRLLRQNRDILLPRLMNGEIEIEG